MSEIKEKFTPRPWIAVDVGYGFRIEPDVCWIGENSNVTKKQLIANKNLILSAPDMYEMLEHIEDVLDDSSGCGEISVEEIRKVLKKARGEE